ncbi:MAG: response regulator transcription factor, partial [Ignavibacteria bacterium]|nr:response regulator transcription factor [Ignavibacteria bacterium]
MDFHRNYSVFLADDHELVRIGLRYYLQSEPMFEVVGEASNGLEAFDKIVYYRPDIAVVDVFMPLLNGVEVLRNIRAEGLKT